LPDRRLHCSREARKQPERERSRHGLTRSSVNRRVSARQAANLPVVLRTSLP